MSTVSSVASQDSARIASVTMPIRRLNAKKVFMCIPEKERKTSSLYEGIEAIIKRHNKTIVDQEKPRYEPFAKDERQGAKDGFKFVSYVLIHPIQPTPLHKFLESHHGDISRLERGKRENHLLFFYKTVQKVHHVFVLAKGTGAWYIVQPYVDYAFPRQVVRRLCEPAWREGSFHPLFGAEIESSRVNRQEQKLQESTFLDALIGKITIPLRADASVRKLPEFQRRQITVAFTTSTITFNIGIPFESFFPLFAHLSIIASGKQTRCYNTEKVENDHPDFAPLEYIQPVSPKKHGWLEDKKNELIWRAFSRDESIPFDFFPHFASEFSGASQFRLRYIPQSGPLSKTTWIGLKSATEFFQMVKSDIPDYGSCSSDSAFIRHMKKTAISYHKGGSTWSESIPLTECLTGEVQYKGLSHFCIGRWWYAISADYASIVHREFTGLIQRGLLDSQAIPLKEWTGEAKRKVTAREFPEGGKSLLKQLTEAEESYVTTDESVAHTVLWGEILENPLIRKHKEAIERELATESFDLRKITRFEKERGAIKRALKKKRKIFTKDLCVSNPLAPKETPDSVKKYLVQKCGEYYSRMSEGKYNESFLDEPGFYVGDRICPRDIELFDLLYVTDEKLYVIHVKEGFNQKTRDAVSQLRNSMELILSAIRHHGGKKRSNILEEFWKKAIETDADGYRKRAKAKYEALGKDGFMQLFAKKLVFVYAVLDDAKGERLLADEGKYGERVVAEELNSLIPKRDGEKLHATLVKEEYLDEQGRVTAKIIEQTKEDHSRAIGKAIGSVKKHAQVVVEFLLQRMSQFRSTIAKLELMRLEKEAIEKGAEFKIYQIRRPAHTRAAPGEGGSSAIVISEDDPEAFEEKETKVLSLAKSYSGLQRDYTACSTRPDGMCALHALLGEKRGDEYVADPSMRKEYINRLSDSEKALEKCNEQLADFLVQVRSGNSSPEARALFGEKGKARALFKAYAGSRKEAEAFINEMEEKEYDKLFELYAECVLEEGYYFSNTELHIAAILFKKRAVLIHNRKKGGIEVADFLTLKELTGDPIVIFHEGNHYERCEPVREG